MKRTIAAIAALLLCTSCASDEVFARSQQAIADQGYTDIQYEGWAGGQSCGSGDLYMLQYSATSMKGRRVKLVACSSNYKGVTVRTLD